MRTTLNLKNNDMRLGSRKKYLQIAFNQDLYAAERSIALLPPTDHIIVEAGTVLIKKYGMEAVSRLVSLWRERIGEGAYVVADLKCMDRGSTEVQAVATAGAAAATCLGLAPIETLDDFIANCRQVGIDSVVDMLNVEFPFEILARLQKKPDIIMLHRAVDEADEKTKQIPYHQIQRIKGSYNYFIAIAGGESAREVGRAFFNGADVAIVWREFNTPDVDIADLAQKYLEKIKSYVR
jgi:bifunctional enzyme Fae/Hps